MCALGFKFEDVIENLERRYAGGFNDEEESALSYELDDGFIDDTYAYIYIYM
jgi:hypothetical protein